MNQGFKMMIANIYSLREGPTVTGRIEQGSVCVGDSLALLGSHGRLRVKVILIQKFHEALSAAHAGPDPIGISLSGVEIDQIRNRDLLMSEEGDC